MRLIDADALLANLDNGIQGTARKYLKFYQMAVNDEPTAYDVDKVIGQLEKLPTKEITTYTDSIPVYDADTWAFEGFTKSYSIEKEFVDKDKAIKIVRAGMKE